MSMLGKQIKELRWLADHLDETERGMDEYVRAMREAADTIDNLLGLIGYGGELYVRDRTVLAELDYVEDKSRWHELFGTPERAARTLHHGGTLVCRECLIREECAKTPEDNDCVVMRYDALLEWLRGDA